MSGKRFELAYETNDQNCIWWAVRNGDVILWKEEVVEELNALSKKNKWLKEKNEQLQNALGHNYAEHKRCVNNYVDKIKEVENENKQLMLKIDTFTEGNKTLQARLKEVDAENKNTKAILEDFMDILNKIQANPTDEKLLNIARDMLQNMGVDLE